MWWINIVLQMCVFMYQWCFKARMLFNLCVIVEVPQVDASQSVHTRKEGGMYRRPHDIINIIRVILKRVQRLVILQQRERNAVSWEIHEWQCSECAWMICYLVAPEFDGPIKRGGQEEMREIYQPSRSVTVNACDWTMMSLKHLTDTCPTAHTHTENDRGLMISISACFHLSGNTSHY